MKTISFKLPELGNAVGTVNWVGKELEKITNSVELSKTKTNKPCLVYTSLSDKDKDGNYKKYVLCTTGESTYFNLINGNSVLYAVESEWNHGLFTYLTPAAEKYVSEFLSNILDGFINELENN